jgi:hypothetical protein
MSIYDFLMLKAPEAQFIELKFIDSAKDKTFAEFYDGLDNAGDVYYTFSKTNPDDLDLLVLSAGLLVKEVEHELSGARQKKAMQLAIDFGHGKIELQELKLHGTDIFMSNDCGHGADMAAWLCSTGIYYHTLFTALEVAKIIGQKKATEIIKRTLTIDKFDTSNLIKYRL